MTIKYPTTQPTFIPLPYDQQIKLRTFANKTNIHFGCEIDPTLKASVAKSIGASVNTHAEQIDNLYDELEKINNLEESTASTIITESDFTTVENTNNGYFDDVKLEGKTLVNKFIDYSMAFPNGLGSELNNGYRVTPVMELSFESLRYEITFKTPLDLSNHTILYNLKWSKSSTHRLAFVYEDGSAEEVRTDVSAKYIYLAIQYYCKINKNIAKLRVYVNSLATLTEGDYAELTDIMILEGDHTQNPPEFFEGLKSVGDGEDEIVVESVKGNGNLCEGNELNISITHGVSDTFSKKIAFRPTSDLVSYFIDCEGSQLNNGNVAFRLLDKNGNILGTPNFITTNLSYYNFKFSDRGIKYSDVYYLQVFWNNNVGKDLVIKNITFVNGSIAPSKHIQYQANKKRILYYNDETQTWEKPILREWDSIEKHSDGKYYYHKRSEEVVLDGSEDWTCETPKENTIYGICTIDGIKYLGEVCCDKFNGYSYSIYDQDIEGVYAAENRIKLKIYKSKLSSQDVQGFKQWLQANPTTVVYQLTQEEVYECTDLDLITYADETNLLVKSGVLNPKVTLKVSNGVGNVVTMLQNKVTMLEQMVYNLMKMFDIQPSNIDE